ncbi:MULTISPECIES: Dabb family protein [unclassified Aeromicrobium]|uniref:Dabb family protein n=1 Tax=unclassified Aeromicrobium TaxID=2633570 RepID=UPI002889A05F|nr:MULTISPECIES: Dabb family protein [unclassified Aeromicrobium]
MALRHLVLFRVYDAVADADVDDALVQLASLATLPGVLEWTVRLSDDRRKGRILVENGLFESQEAFEAFRVHPQHVQVSTVMRDLADWWIGDYEEPADT